MYREDESQRHTVVAFVVTALLYFGIGGIIWYLQQRLTVSDETPKIQKIDLKLSAFSQESLPQPQQKAQPLPTPPPKSEPPTEVSKQEPPKKEIPKEAAAKEPVPVAKQAEHVSKKPVKPKKRIVKKAVVPKPKPKVKKYHKKSASAKHTKIFKSKHRKKAQKHSAQTSAAKAHYSSAAKNRFLARIRQRIDRHKSYPRIAKKRRMQGAVKVRFTILPNGKLGAVSAEGPKVFLRSARQAVIDAFPVSVKAVPMHLPATVNLTLRYQIR